MAELEQYTIFLGRKCTKNEHDRCEEICDKAVYPENYGGTELSEGEQSAIYDRTKFENYDPLCYIDGFPVFARFGGDEAWFVCQYPLTCLSVSHDSSDKVLNIAEMPEPYDPRYKLIILADKVGPMCGWDQAQKNFDEISGLKRERDVEGLSANNAKIKRRQISK